MYSVIESNAVGRREEGHFHRENRSNVLISNICRQAVGPSSNKTENALNAALCCRVGVLQHIRETQGQTLTVVKQMLGIFFMMA